MPTSVMIPKNSTEKMNRDAVEWTPLTPDAMKSPTSFTLYVPVKTSTIPVTVVTPINASDGTVTFLSNKMMIIIIVANPKSASIVSFISCSLPFVIFLVEV